MAREADGLSFLQTQGPEGIDKLALTTRADSFLEKFDNWVQSHSIVPFVFDTACCSLEYGWHFNDQFAHDSFSPEQIEACDSDLLLIGGTINLKTYPLIRKTYEQMPKKKWVVAIGACPMSGGPFPSYNVVKDVSKDIPVDIFIPGCPPTPQDIMDGMKLLKQRIEMGVMASGNS
ncbi:hypothetical protein A9Q84_02315 [Halobacteriovorax marinus]|uniref:NADH:ubiquinone oxidoreductase-like 20kDa subunit domain-containing protein n=1 Tax=Halobacteriovorax marinus TaxID=97084 RepID=A0A1Y5FCM4_9BACT|nr:hypothetical protein A9Q84_02315 [Halobacteriovorax marinus]